MINGVVKSDKPTERQEQRKGSALAFLGWTFVVLSLLWLPIVTSPIAVILGFLTKKVEGRDIQGPVIMIAAIAGGVVGLLGGLYAGDKG
ncbi:hypothetical protein [Paenibacillus terrae]|uniref:hypothetical protein n=1 Tax=Paenibacillus terrae TaxID=159743 RepID=UPI0011EAB025|nr:hypothetical protein [Paenibacillus terrae]